MIFVTVGTILPFDRLMRGIDDWVATSGRTDVVGQVGDLSADSYRPQHFKWSERLSPVDFRHHIETADVIVAHAGIGTIVDALTRAKPILIMARQHALHEHVNDHQLETVAKFADRPGVRVVDQDAQIGSALEALLQAPAIEPLGPDAQNSLIGAIKSTIWDTTSQP